jgi:L-alanine-DL-glutamate epimerase-like enolase superfamily enzyme
MIIKDIEFKKIKVELKKPIKLSYGAIYELEPVIVKIITDIGLVGYGEASSIPFVTGEVPDGILAVLTMFKNILIGLNPLEIEKINDKMDELIVHNSAAKASIDIALHDLLGKFLNEPLYKVLGGFSDSYMTDVMISIDSPERMAKEAIEFVQLGIKMLKIKGGLNINDDINAVASIREVVGKDVILRFDANQGYSISDTLKFAESVKEYSLEAIEQPLLSWDIEGHKYLKRKLNGLTLILDESIHSPRDASYAIDQNAADMFSIKLQKAGGISRALEINSIAEKNGIPCMVGCMPVTSIGLSAAAHLVASQKNITVGDTDSFLLIHERDIIPGFTFKKGVIQLSNQPGLGVTVSNNFYKD